MSIFLLFILGIGNFAMHKAVLESGHPLLGQMPWFVHLLGGRFGLLVEYALLLAAMLITANATTPQGLGGAAIAYVFYTMANGFSAWMIITRRI